MKLPNLTLFKYSILFDRKQWQTHLIRFLQLAALLVCLSFFLHETSRITAPGLVFFKIISYINLVFIVIAGLALFPSVVTEEKEVNNLHLLLMTGLSLFSLILSKSTSKLIEGTILLTVQIPS